MWICNAIGIRAYMCAALAMAGVLLFPASGFAQPDQDKRPLKIVVGFSPGNGADIIARLLADKMTTALGVPVIVENKPGAGSRIAVDLLKSAPADGKTIMIATFSAMGMYPMISSKSSYQLTDFAPIAYVADNHIAMTGSIDAPFTNLKEFSAWLKLNPDKSQFGTESIGAPGHILGIEFARRVGVPMTSVAYKTTAQMITDQIGGHITAATWALPSVQKLHQSKQLRVLGIAAAERSPNAPDIPTFREMGYDIVMTGIYGFYAPAKTPLPILDQLSKAIVDATGDPVVQQTMRQIGLEPTGKPRADFLRVIAEHEKSWAQIIKNTGFRLND